MDNTFKNLMIVFFLAFTLFATFVFFNKPLTQLTRASEEQNASPANSLIFAWPLNLPADGATEATITVFARNKDGKALPNKQIGITTTHGDLREDILNTDNEGKAEFRISATTQGLAQIEAMVDNIKIEKSVSIKFE